MTNNVKAVPSFVNSGQRIPCRPKLKEIQEIFKERSFKAAQAQQNGDVIILFGHSTAGKSSIISALTKIEPERIEDGFDLRNGLIAYEYYKQKCRNEVEKLEKVMEPIDIAKAIDCSNFRKWKIGVSEIEKNEAEELIQSINMQVPPGEMQDMTQEEANNIEPKIYDYAFDFSRKGGNVVFDALFVDKVAQHALMHVPIRKVLVYCPFDKLVSRIERRNNEALRSGDLTDVRDLHWPLLQFSKVFTQKNESQETWEVITRREAIQAIEDAFDKKVIADRQMGCIVPSEEIILQDKANIRQEFLDNLGFKEGMDQVEIAPRNEELFDFYINTDMTPPNLSADLLHEGVGIIVD